MGKGSGDDCRGAISLDAVMTASTPGKSERARHTYRLLEAAGGFSDRELLRDIRSRDGRTIDPSKADASVMSHNAMMRWVPSSFPGHAGYVPAHEPARWELHFSVLLDGDRRANHLYFYNDKVVGGQWTLPAGAAVRGWYKLPCDEHGHLDPAGLKVAVQRSVHAPDGLFVENLRARPSATLAQCADLPEPGAGTGEFRDRLDPLSPEARGRVLAQFEQAGLKSPEHKRTLALRVRDALELAAAAALSVDERDVLVAAAAFAPEFGQTPSYAQEMARYVLDRDAPQLAEPVFELLAELEPHPADDGSGLPVLTPASKLGRLLADAQQGWMASSWCDVAAEAQRQALNAADDETWLDRSRLLAARSPWHSPQGRARFQGEARKQESRLRSLIGLQKAVKTPAAPKGLKKLRAAAPVTA